VNSLTRCKPLLGTFVEIALQGDVSEQTLIEQSNRAFAQIQKIHSAMSFHESSSELSLINLCSIKGKSTRLSSSMRILFEFIEELNTVSKQLFDPSIAPELIKNKPLPAFDKHCGTGYSNTDFGRWSDIELDNDNIHFNQPVLIDLGGIAKGYAVDKAIECVAPNISMTVNAGGDIRVTDWQTQSVFITSPSQDSAHDIETPMLASSIATSASYYNDGQSVMINPKTLATVENQHSISVFADNCLSADALTKVVWLSPDYQHILDHYDAKALIIDSQNQQHK